MANEQKKYTTFLSMVNANKKDGTFVSATVGGLIRRFKSQDVNGKKRIRASMPVQNRAKTINYMLGTSFQEGDNDTVATGIASGMDSFYSLLRMVAIPIAAVTVAFAAFQIFTGGEKGMEKAKKLLLCAFIGVGIVLLAPIIIKTVASWFSGVEHGVSVFNN